MYAGLHTHTDTEDTLDTLYSKLSKKAAAELRGGPVRPGCLKYDWNDTVWNMDDGAFCPMSTSIPLSIPSESDFSIFAWRLKSSTPGGDGAPVLHLRDPDQPLPRPSEYRNLAFYMFRPRTQPTSPQLPASPDSTSVRSGKSRKRSKDAVPKAEVPKFKEEFEKFHNENGVRTVTGSIGPVNNGEWMACAPVPTVGPEVLCTRARVCAVLSSSNAAEERIPPCVHFAQVCD